jgi:hypothetical protein
MNTELERLLGPDLLAALDERMRRIAEEAAPPPPVTEDLISLKTASRRFDIPVDTLKKWLRTGRLRKFKIEGCVRVRPSDLLRESEIG